jgi:hypothetical protein
MKNIELLLTVLAKKRQKRHLSYHASLVRVGY